MRFHFMILAVIITNTELFGRMYPDSIISPDDYQVPYDYSPVVRYQTMHQRVKALEREIPLHFNSIVKDFIDYFTVRNRDYTRRVIKRSKIFFPIIEEHLAKHGIPEELKYLAIVESALYPRNTSPMGAAGLWQLMIPTARQYGLKINNYVDERMDPHRSTDAAARLFKWLYNSFGDWELALAAYNIGYGNINKAIRKAGKRSFWSIYRYLPAETRSFVPQFVALTYVMNYQEEHNLHVYEGYSPEVRELKVFGHVDLKELSENMNYCLEDLQELNPHLMRAYIPKNRNGIKLNIPYDLLPLTLLLYDEKLKSTGPDLYSSERNPSVTVYTVQEGDSLWKISLKFDNVTIEGLKEMNNIDHDMIKPGQELIIPMD